VTSPYRAAPQLLICPRCEEMLDRVFAGVAACPRCHGAWITHTTLDVAFGNPRWPPGQNMWWHAELDCPECKCEGSIRRMDARSAGGVMADVCPSHGLWLDHGELARLMKLERGSDELLELQKKVSTVAPDPDELAKRRLAWRTELDSRRRQTAEFRAWLEGEARRKAAEALAAAKAAEAEQERALADAEEKREVRDAVLAAQAEVARLDRDRRERELKEHELRLARRASALAELDRRRAVLGSEQDRVTSIEIEMNAKVTAAKKRVSAAENELAVAERSLAEIEEELRTGKPGSK
jgi:Zn-finger nucleic acid-binding protein